MNRKLALVKAPSAVQYRRDAAVYFATGIWPEPFTSRFRLRWQHEAGCTKTSINPHKGA